MEGMEKEVPPNCLYHIWGDKEDDFFRRIEEFGGWPPGKAWVGFEHTGGMYRPCRFVDREVRHEWFTANYSADDYYWWKVSDARKLKYKNKVTAEVAGFIRNLEWKKP